MNAERASRDPVRDDPAPETPAATPQPPATGRVAGIDFGTVRIGVALSDPLRHIASPHATYTRRSPEADAAYFRRLVEQEEVRLFVVGLPVHLSGDESAMSHAARRFGDWLGQQTGVPVVYFDERFSSHQAEEWLLAADMSRKRRRARRDRLAAQVLLAGYLESGAKQPVPPAALDD